MSDLTELQLKFLDDLQRKRSPVAIYLKNGIKLKGIIRGFDSESLLLDHPSMQLILTKAVSTIAPLITFQSFTEE